MKPETVELLKKLAEDSTRTDDGTYETDCWFGGNSDDAYDGGRDDGKVLLARKILTAEGIPFSKPVKEQE